MKTSTPLSASRRKTSRPRAPAGAQSPAVRSWADHYLARQRDLCGRLPVAELTELVEVLHAAHRRGAQIFVFGNGGSAANASHFATDLGKGASDALGTPFRIVSLNDNTAWLTAIGNDYAYDEIFLRQLQNYGRPGDVALCLSVSGSSPNLVKAMAWARAHGLQTVAMVGAKRGRLAEMVERLLVVPDDHYGRVEDAQMTLCHLLAYAFIEKVAGAETSA